MTQKTYENQIIVLFSMSTTGKFFNIINSDIIIKLLEFLESE